MSLVDYAKSELERAFPHPDDLQKHAMRNVMELIKLVAKQGHTNTSVHYVLALFNRLVEYKPLGPLNGYESEWGEPHGEDNSQQNKRCSAVFRKNFDNGTAYNIEGILFEDKDGVRYMTGKSRVPVKFPYRVPGKPEIRKDYE